MSYYTSTLNKKYSEDIINFANEAANYYFNNNLKSCFKKCAVAIYLINKEYLGLSDTTESNIGQTVFRNKFEKRFNDLFYNEFRSVCLHIIYAQKYNCYPTDYEIKYIFYFLDYFLSALGFVKCDNNVASNSKAVRKEIISYLNNINPFFSREDNKKYKNYAKGFNRCAYRVEKYSHALRANYETTETIDCFVPFIIARMTVEQFVKHFAHKYNLVVNPEEKCSVLIDKLAKKKIIDRRLKNDFKVINKRGNFNTHNASPNYQFSLVHSLDVIKHCKMILDDDLR